jgi:hypothetical protein
MGIKECIQGLVRKPEGKNNKKDVDVRESMIFSSDRVTIDRG